MNRWFSFVLFSCVALVALAVFFVNAQGWEPYVDPNSPAQPAQPATPPTPSVAVSVAQAVANSLESDLHGCKFITEVTSVPNKFVATPFDISGYPNFQHFVLVVNVDGKVRMSRVFEFFQSIVLGGPGSWRATVEEGFTISKDKSPIAAERILQGVNGNGKSETILKFKSGLGYSSDPIVGVTDDSTITHEIYSESGRTEDNDSKNLVLYIDGYQKSGYTALGWSFDGFGLHPNFKGKKNAPIITQNVQIYAC